MARGQYRTTPSGTTLLIALALLMAGVAEAPAQAAGEDRPPNLIVLLVDDWGWRDAGCFGSDLYETPHIDRLAAEGVKFTDAYAACTVCSPTRGALLTGQYPDRAKLDGASLLPLLRHPYASLDREAIYWHYHSGGAEPHGAVRAGDWELITFEPRIAWGSTTSPRTSANGTTSRRSTRRRRRSCGSPIPPWPGHARLHLC